MLRVHKIKLNPNQAQAIYFAKSCGVARHAYNWALAEWKRQYKAGEKPNEAALRKQYNSIKPVEFPWALEVTKCAAQQAIKNAGTAYKNFFDRIKKGKKGAEVGYPKFKRKGVHDSFRADNGPATKGANAAPTDGKKIKLPIIGWIRMREEVRFSGTIQSTTVSRMADGWYISVLVETEDRLQAKANHGAVGVDLGLKRFATLSTGEFIVGPKPHRALGKRLRRLNQSLSRKTQGSANFPKAKTKLSNLHKRIADIRQDAVHKLSHRLVTEYSVIGIEDLNVKGMGRNGRLGRSVGDAGMRMFRTQIEYKAAMTGAFLYTHPLFAPSTKVCSDCGRIHDMPLGKDTLSCDCGLIIDRDLNASIILKTAASSAVAACGEFLPLAHPLRVVA
jgi:putative transposase